MALLGAAFQIGRSALAAYQSAIAVTGQNIANLGNPNYTRQSGRLEAIIGGPTLSGLAPGGGVKLGSLERHVDVAVESGLRNALSNRRGAQTAFQSLARVESLYNEFTGVDLSTGLAEFFGAFATLQTNPQDNAARGLIINAGDQVVNELRRIRTGLLDEISSLNDGVKQAVARADTIASEIASLNHRIVAEEARSPGGSGALRDRRDALLRELSEYMDVQVRESDNGTINVYVGSDPLVDFNRSRGLTVQLDRAGGIETFSVRFTDDNGLVRVRDGEIAAVVATRDQYIRGQIQQIDQLAAGLIYEVNRIHSSGVGLVGRSVLDGTNPVLDPGAALNSAAAGLGFPVQNGVLFVHVRHPSTGQQITRQIEVDLDGIGNNDTSLNDLVAAFSSVPGLTAGVLPDGRITIKTTAGAEVWFSEDSSGVLAALGVGGFFTGVHAGNIAVSSAVRSNPGLIAASRSGLSNDGSNAGRLALLASSTSALLGGRSLGDFHADLFGGAAASAAAMRTRAEAADVVHASLVAQRESISGVSLDEEAINLTKFERAFQGASRYIGVVDQMTTELLSLLR